MRVLNGGGRCRLPAFGARGGYPFCGAGSDPHAGFAGSDVADHGGGGGEARGGKQEGEGKRGSFCGRHKLLGLAADSSARFRQSWRRSNTMAFMRLMRSAPCMEAGVPISESFAIISLSFTAAIL